MLELKNVSFVRSDRYILRNINISIEPNQNWVILGKNGSGKTTLINLIFGYHWPTVGIVKVFGKTYGEFPIRNIQHRIGILQSYYQEERVQRNL
ncbi:MAG: ATP-binding cassette domain-containing protein, partial [Leptospiraceae bacterium]|nr:ATP-binding cassette domain-containing protein [Leptospiraceae bacterium]